MTFQEWVSANQATYNSIPSQNIKDYLLNKFHNLPLIMSASDAVKYFKFKYLEFKVEIDKIIFLEAQYQKVWADATLINPTISTCIENTNEKSNVGYNADSVYARVNNNNNVNVTTKNILDQLTQINDWLTKLYPKLDNMVVGMLATIKNVGE